MEGNVVLEKKLYLSRNMRNSTGLNREEIIRVENDKDRFIAVIAIRVGK